MDPRGLAPYSCPEATVNTQGESHIPGRSQEQKGKKRKYDFGKHGKGFKKRKGGVKQVLNSLDKQISQLNNKIENQENLVDKLLHQMKLGSEVFELLIKEESAILCPDSNNWDVLIFGN